jgi:hypothetical protein
LGTSLSGTPLVLELGLLLLRRAYLLVEPLFVRGRTLLLLLRAPLLLLRRHLGVLLLVLVVLLLLTPCLSAALRMSDCA